MRKYIFRRKSNDLTCHDANRHLQPACVVWACGLAALLLLPLGLDAATPSRKMPVVAKWGRFEQSFQSAIIYSNALQDATLTVRFVSPLGETNQVYGFWDGARTWRVRFSPDQPGRWQFQTTCSDAANEGLHHRTGEFICTAATGASRFNQHGPVRVSRDHLYLEHADGTPFFWLADTAWNGPRVAQNKDWEFYARTRARQQFSVVQWAVAPGEDVKGQSAISGYSDRIAINPEFFQRLDARLTTLSRAGLLSAIEPVLEKGPQAGSWPALSDEQITLLVRYIVARWSAEPVVWLLTVDNHSPARNAARWQQIGRAVFTEGFHAPVMACAAAAPESLAEFRDQKWVDIFGWPGGTDYASAGAFLKTWTNGPARPLICFTPYENGTGAPGGGRFSSDAVRHAAYAGLLLSVPAGVSYGGHGVTDWDTSVELKKDGPTIKGADQPLWKRAMFMPAAKQMSTLANCMNSVDFWRLLPQPQILAAPPSSASFAAATEKKDLAVVYVSEGRTLTLVSDALPPAPALSWLNPRTGESILAVAEQAGPTRQFPTPGPGDWVFTAKVNK